MTATAPTVRTTGVAALLAALVTTLAGLAPQGAAHAQVAAVEYAVKAAYLYKLAPFVDWPASAFPSAASPFELCILGHDPFGASLDQAVAGQRVKDHPVVVRRLDRVDAETGCHILYLGASRSQTGADALRSVRGTPVLTVAENSRAGSTIIQFVMKDNRVRFDIDTAAAALNHVTISSKLLSLASSVKTGPSSRWDGSGIFAWLAPFGRRAWLAGQS